MAQNYYIFRNGRIRRKAHTVYFITPDGPKTPLPVENIEALWLFGVVRLHTRLLTFLAQKGIPLHVFNHYGFYSGSFLPRRRHPSGRILIHQVEHYLDPARRRAIAGEIVDGSVFHMARLLRDYVHRGKPLQAAVQDLEDIRADLHRWQTIDELRAAEGRARHRYYQAFAHVTEMAEYPFVRTRRPPTSPMNALLSFGNALLYPAILQEIYRTPLDPTVSYLHEPGERRFSLVLDFADIFRPLIVEPTVLRLVNTRQMAAEDFEAIGDGVFLSEAGRKKVLKAFDATLQRTVQHRRLKRHVSYRQLFRLEAYKLVRHLVGDEPYTAFRAWW
jgi:CRISPR-associated protein Cas1